MKNYQFFVLFLFFPLTFYNLVELLRYLFSQSDLFKSFIERVLDWILSLSFLNYFSVLGLSNFYLFYLGLYYYLAFSSFLIFLMNSFRYTFKSAIRLLFRKEIPITWFFWKFWDPQKWFQSGPFQNTKINFSEMWSCSWETWQKGFNHEQTQPCKLKKSA